MRFMLLLKGDSDPGETPGPEVFEAMGRYNDQLAQAGALLAAEGLLSSATGTRVTHSKGGTSVTDGPFTESKELLAGFWMIEVGSKEEAVEWARRAPLGAGEEFGSEAVIEVRQIAELSDFPDMTPAQKADEQALRDRLTGA
ncbi:YciI family protein [Georgenia sp. SYP-B2076]|uniref:YciI family protein n=1 Tax=Georgenia sp. SYP-B2076 TaxID=2495881 RepID=UPI000F8C6F40|nr:YciI family protein [Georgenia sp. SYP-B2076]